MANLNGTESNQGNHTIYRARTAHSYTTKSNHMLHFDTDSFDIGVDNHASRCMSNDRKHFVGNITPLKGHKVKGIGNKMLQVKGVGTISWKIEDDQGMVHKIHIKGSLYVPDLPICLWSPQHWAKQAADNNPDNRGTWCATYEDSCILYWDQ